MRKLLIHLSVAETLVGEKAVQTDEGWKVVSVVDIVEVEPEILHVNVKVQ